MNATTIKVLSPGTAVQASPKSNTRVLLLKARPSNSGTIYAGASDVSAADGMALPPGDAITLAGRIAQSFSNIWADADIANDQLDITGAQA